MKFLSNKGKLIFHTFTHDFKIFIFYSKNLQNRQP